MIPMTFGRSANPALIPRLIRQSTPFFVWPAQPIANTVSREVVINLNVFGH